MNHLRQTYGQQYSVRHLHIPSNLCAINMTWRKIKAAGVQKKGGQKRLPDKHLVDPDYLHKVVKVMSQHFDVKNSTLYEINPG